jgi:hypothetical protein
MRPAARHLARMMQAITRPILTLIIMALVSGCVSGPKLESVFDPSEAEAINQSGFGAVIGQAFVTRSDGSVAYAAGSEVYLIPTSTYADAHMAYLFQGRKFNNTVERPSTEPAYLAMTKRTKADADGRFTFSLLADGNYYLLTRITWKEGKVDGGGDLMEFVSLSGGQTVQVFMTGQ